MGHFHMYECDGGDCDAPVMDAARDQLVKSLNESVDALTERVRELEGTPCELDENVGTHMHMATGGALLVYATRECKVHYTTTCDDCGPCGGLPRG